MYAVLRQYSGDGASALFNMIEERKAEVEKLLRAVEGFESYTCARSDEGGFTMTVCQDKAGTDREPSSSEGMDSNELREHWRRGAARI